MSKKLEIIATVNTHKISDEFLIMLMENGVTIIRINGAHVKVEEIGQSINIIKNVCEDKVKVLIDLPGNKIRTKNIYQNVNLRINEKFELMRDNFNYDRFISFLNEGDIVTSSDGQLKMKVDSINEKKVIFFALCDGKLLNNKGIHIRKGDLSKMPFLFRRDMDLIEETKKHNVDYVGFSFVRSKDNLIEAYRLLDSTNITPIFKLETKEATEELNLQILLESAEYFLIDRGDLASEVGIAEFPRIFNKTLESVLSKEKNLFVATQLFASMYENNLPYISEVLEFHRIVNSGVFGIQLSEEIAIGKYPKDVLKLIKSLNEDLVPV